MAPPTQTLTATDIEAVRAILAEGLKSAESFNKVYIALASFIGVILGMLVQMVIAWWQMRTQQKIAAKQDSLFQRQLGIQREANLRVAQDNVAVKRQVWIDELRKDTSSYLATWQEIAWLWDAMISMANEENIATAKGHAPKKGESVQDKLPAFKERVAALRFGAHEVQLRIRLRLNPTETKHVELIGLLSNLEKTVRLFNRWASNFDGASIQRQVNDTIEAAVAKLQIILKEEWNRVKNGEMPRSEEADSGSQ
jgi:hypothetical protein